EQRLACTRRAYQQCTLRDLATELREFAWVLQKLDDLTDFLLRLIEAGHIRECNFDFVLGIEERRLGFSNVENLSTGTSASCHPEHEHPKPEQQQEEETPLGTHPHIVNSLGADVLYRGSAWICLYQLVK